jgi:hypothetical protein
MNMMIKARSPKQAGYMLPGILCAIMIWYAGVGEAKAACNAGNILYNDLEIVLSKDVVYVGGTVTATVTTDPTDPPDPPVNVTLTSISSKISITPTLGLPTPAEFTITGVTKSDLPGDVPLVAEIISGVETVTGEVSCVETSSITVIKVDLDAMKVSHNVVNGELPEDQETSPGAFVPINNDDDDYAASNTGDKDQLGAITGESDLLPIKLHKVDPVIAGSIYTLDIPSQVKIWQNPDRSGEVSGTTEFDATVDTTLYVEGFTVGSGSVKINWKSGTTTVDDCDEIKVSVFQWLGPLNVPGYAIYRYTASGALGTSKWITPGSGTIKAGTDTSDVTILWDGGPVVGTAVYQVNSDYVWALEVNVVQIKPKSGTSNKITYKNPPLQTAAGNGQIRSHSTGPAIDAKLTVEKIKGPSVGGVMRGVKFMEVGFIQNWAMPREHGNFDGFTPKKRRVASLEGGSGVDYFTEAANASTPPWYDSKDATGTDGFLAPGTDAEVTDHPLNVGDTPRITGSDTFALTIGGVTDDVDDLGIEFDLNLRIPAAAGHPFRFEPDTCSDFGRTLIPESPDTCSDDAGHP